KDEWEIVDFRTEAHNALAFNGLVRRPTQREWTLEAAVVAAAKVEADKLRAELIHKQHAGDPAASAEAGSTPGDKAAGPDSLRQLRDTDRDNDPEALADEAATPAGGAEDWSNLDSFEDDLPVFFDAIKPHLRKNQNSNWQSVALNYLAKRWEQPETDLIGALKECGFIIPEADTDAPAYLEFEGDLYWVEVTNRGLFFLNTREKPRAKFRIARGKPLDAADPAVEYLAEEQAAADAEKAKRASEQAAREAEAQARRAEREAQKLAAEQARREQQAAAHAAREAREAARLAAKAALESAAPVLPPAGPEGVVADPAAPARELTLPVDPAASLASPLSEVAASEPMGEVDVSSPGARPAAAPARNGKLLSGKALLDAIRPQMRRNRRGPGYSGSSIYLAKFFKVEEPALRSALAELGLAPAATPSEKVETKLIGAYVYWVNLDGNGVLWINGRETSPRDRGEAAKASSPSASAASAEVTAAPVSPDTSGAALGSAAPSAAAPSAEDSGREAPIFRAVPRAMPALPPSEPSEENSPSFAPLPARIESTTRAVSIEGAEGGSGTATERASALLSSRVPQGAGEGGEATRAQVTAKSSKANPARKARPKVATTLPAQTGELALDDPSASSEAKSAKSAAGKSRRKRRVPAATEVDTKAES
ncbi:MAG: hypothetical protein EAZ36_04510, partial [Verrucomicrobia bacterium]